MTIVVNKIYDRSFTIHFVEEKDRVALLECLARGMNTWQKQSDEPGKTVYEFIKAIQ